MEGQLHWGESCNSKIVCVSGESGALSADKQKKILGECFVTILLIQRRAANCTKI
jgi:hypothetical protein